MKQRIITGSILIAILILGLCSQLLTPFIFDGIIACIMVIGAVEFSKLLLLNKKSNFQFLAGLFPSLFYGCFLTCLILGKSIYFTLVTEVILVIVCFIILLLISLMCREKFYSEMKAINFKGSFSKFVTFKSLNTLYTFIYPTFLLGTLTFINHYCDFFAKLQIEHWFTFSLFLLIITFSITISTDTFAYFIGSNFKGPKLCKKISPNKTISGAIGGICGAILFTTGLYLIAYYCTPLKTVFSNLNLNIYYFLLLGFICSIISQIGDIFESFIKRKAGVKDSGKIFPGHGGVLDRFDSLIFASVIIFIFILIFVI